MLTSRTLNRLTRALMGAAALLVPMLSVLPDHAAARAAPAADAVVQHDQGAAGIDEQRFVEIGGIAQWVTIRGRHRANPVILFLHGGPGNPMSPYAAEIYRGWEADFTLVQWDQRGAGKTYGRNPSTAEAPLSLELMTRDGIELTTHLARHLDKRKLILVGGSWGSVLAVHMAKARPDLYLAYVGTGQLVDGAENLAASRRKVMDLARAAGDATTLSVIEALGAPPWTDPRSFGVLRRATRTYEKKTSLAAPAAWWQPAPAYATPAAQANYESAEDYSYLEFVGPTGNGMLNKIDLRKLGTDFSVPVFLLQGAEDLVTVPEVAKRYFDAIVAPQKDYFVLPGTGHEPNVTMIDAQLRVLKTRVPRF